MKQSVTKTVCLGVTVGVIFDMLFKFEKIVSSDLFYLPLFSYFCANDIPYLRLFILQNL